jgi:D-alanyl-D-alanine-carboxypeptidase/D-alanyl-D-alanine-endopeptidase
VPPRGERLLERYARRLEGTGAGVVALVSDGGEPRLIARGRTAAGRPGPPDAETLFEIGSITKTVTALALADMDREGLVGLDDPVADHLPPGVRLRVKDRPPTLADLASHTSGLPRVGLRLLLSALADRSNPYARFGVPQLEQAVRRARLRPPGKVRYSNLGAGLLGHVLSRRAGMPYEELVRERVLGPLGMDDTRIALSPEDHARLAGGHDRRGRPAPGWDLPALPGAGALRSSAADVMRLLEAQLRPPAGRLGDAIRLTHLPRARRGKLQVGLAWMRMPLGAGRQVVWHDGGTGGHRGFAGFAPASGAAVVVLASSARSVTALGMALLEEAARR